MYLGYNKLIPAGLFLMLGFSNAIGQAGLARKITLNDSEKGTSIEADKNGFHLSYYANELLLNEVTTDSGKFVRISLPGHLHSVKTGEPELPALSRLITIPDGARAVIKITDVKITKISLKKAGFDIPVYPAQESEIKSDQKNEKGFIIDRKLYRVNGFIPADTVSIDYSGISRGRQLANIYINPVRYNPAKGDLEVISSMKVDVWFITSEYEPLKQAQTVVPYLLPVTKGILNYNPDEVIPGYREEPVKLLILTDTAFRTQIEPFVKWKTRKGFDVTVLYKGADFAGIDYPSIKSTLTDIYTAALLENNPPEYLLIIGDVNKIPHSGTSTITDMYYGEYDGNGDYIPELFIGRIPAADTTQVLNTLGKIIQYENFEFADTNDFYSRSIITAGYDATYIDFMNGQVKYGKDNYLNLSNNIDGKHFFYFPSRNTTAHRDSVVSMINEGTSFINYTGHGLVQKWMHIEFDTAVVRKLKNKFMYPLVISNACQTGKFSASYSLGNRMLLSPYKGAIGFIGCSADSYWSEDFYWAVGLGSPSNNPLYETTGLGALDRIFHTHGEPASDWYFSMGQIVYAGNLAVNASTSPKKKYYWETYNLAGDPTVIPIIGTPGSFNISLPDTLPNGLRSYTFSADPFSYIAITHNDTLVDASHVSLSGTITLDFPGLTEDSCLVVITGQNKKPLIKKIYFSEIVSEFINLSGTTINDVEANNNQSPDFSETFYLDLKVSNLGNTAAEGLYAKISTASENVTLLIDSAMIGSVAAGSESNLIKALKLKADDFIDDKTSVTINLLLKDKYTEKEYKINLLLHAPVLRILSMAVDDSETGNGDMIPDAGESVELTFRVENSGSSPASGVFSISSPSPGITLTETSKNSGNLDFGEITTIKLPAKISEEVYSGSSININSLLVCNLYTDNQEFSFRTGKIRESFEAASFRVFPWINISAKPWTITNTYAYDGFEASRSGLIGHGQKSIMAIKTNYAIDDSISFYYKVSSEASYDFLVFKINGVEKMKVSGEINWIKKSFGVPAGYNYFEWQYQKDNTVSQGLDASYVDKIDFSKISGVEYIYRDIVLAKLTAPDSSDNYSKEDVTVKLLNAAPDTINGFYLAYSLNGNSPVIEYFNSKIVPFSDSLAVTFKTQADLSRYGIYDLVVYSLNNKDDYILNDTLKISIENTDIDEPLLAFPNPFSTELNIIINAESEGNSRISLFDLSGRKIDDFELPLVKGENSTYINGSHLARGIYLLKIVTPERTRVFRVIKMND